MTRAVKRPSRDEVRIFDSAADFRAWLAEHGETATELFVGYWRKGVDRSAMTYPESVDQALCFGWIDGITYRVDDEVTATRFTPRRPGSYWSAVNVGKVERLMAEGLMTDAGLRAFERRTRSEQARYSYENRPADLPAEYAARLHANAEASRWWQAQTASYRRGATWWVISAKRPETRDRRLDQLIAACAACEPIKPFSYGLDKARGATS